MRVFTAAVAVVLFSITLLSGYGLHLYLGLDDLSSWGNYLTGAGTLLLGLIAVWAAIQGVREYRTRVRTERMRLLTQFYEKFYENGVFRQIRRSIDFDQARPLRQLIEKDQKDNAKFSSAECKLFDSFTDYLNFFEMMAYMNHESQITEGEIEAMFGYYLARMLEVFGKEALLPYLTSAGFEHLPVLLVKYLRKHNAKAA
jgi:hypothetical protein